MSAFFKVHKNLNYIPHSTVSCFKNHYHNSSTQYPPPSPWVPKIISAQIPRFRLIPTTNAGLTPLLMAASWQPHNYLFSSVGSIPSFLRRTEVKNIVVKLEMEIRTTQHPLPPTPCSLPWDMLDFGGDFVAQWHCFRSWVHGVFVFWQME